jgi:hypothetical protein
LSEVFSRQEPYSNIAIPVNAAAAARYSSSSGGSSDSNLGPCAGAGDGTPTGSKGTTRTHESSDSQSLESILAGVRSGILRPAVPAGTSPPIATLMQECWAQQPERRPRFQDIETQLDSLKPEQVYSQAWALRVRQRSGGNSGGLARFFPPALAAEIEQGKKVPPQQLDRVSIFFSDVVGFTALSGRMEASRVINHFPV